MKKTRKPSLAGRIKGGPHDVVASPVTLSGDFLSRMFIVRSTTMSMVVSPGKLEGGKTVLVPFIGVTLTGSNYSSSSEEGDKVFSEILSFENSGYLIADLAGEMSEAISQLGEIVSSRAAPDRQRLDVMLMFLTDAREKISQSIERIEAMKSAL